MSREETRNDLQMPKRENHELERAIQRIRVLYDEAKHTSGIRNPLIWSLYQTWNELSLAEPRLR